MKFIKVNKNLVHLDLTNCGLSYLMIQSFGKTLRRAKGLRALHLSGNPALYDPKEKERLVNFLVQRAHGIRVDSYNIIDFKQMPTNRDFRNKFSDHHMERYNKMVDPDPNSKYNKDKS